MPATGPGGLIALTPITPDPDRAPSGCRQPPPPHHRHARTAGPWVHRLPAAWPAKAPRRPPVAAGHFAGGPPLLRRREDAPVGLRPSGAGGNQDGMLLAEVELSS